MKLEVTKIIFILSFGLALSGCTHNGKGDGTTWVRIPLADSAGNYSLQTVQLKSVRDLHAMSDDAAAINVGAKYRADVDDFGRGSLTIEGSGKTPSAQFVKVDEVFHPSDFRTLAMTTTLFHFERIASFFSALGATSGLNFPRRVDYDVQFSFPVESGSHIQMTNNAAFVDALDVFWINPYSLDKIPLGMNPGVLAHEWFHSVFAQKTRAVNFCHGQGRGMYEWSTEGSRPNACFQGTPKNSSEPQQTDFSKDTGDCGNGYDKANEFMMASLNEGLADYFGYLYSKNPQFEKASVSAGPATDQRSLDQEKSLSLDGENQRLEAFRAMTVKDLKCRWDVHDLGSYFGRFFYLVSQDPDWKESAPSAVLAFVDRYAELLAKNHSTQFLTAGSIVKTFFADQKPKGNLCEHVRALFSADKDLSELNCAAGAK